ncbi:unnamed protein product [Thlaspi arvense]|uniref:TIR domain-containing protein n=1 Tax=Thlaspi arvense TaxID=13288 RepID=A0AAU9SNS6_THLAR|nr:unnamed protein product [Thlaspi arvense]
MLSKVLQKERRIKMITVFKKLSCFKKTIKSMRLFESRSSLSSLSSSSFTPQRFDVFLSFRGADTRKNFVSFLYKELEAKGIRTFMDDKELVRGRAISPELRQAIKSSRYAIVVVSANYPASSWCLEELRAILKLHEKGLLTVMPIFYEVDPSHVGRQIGEVAKQFKKHEKRNNRDKVKSWRSALTKLAGLSGECSKNWEDDSKLVDGITEKISKMMSSATPSNGNSLIGIEQHMNELYPLMDLNSNEEVRVVGIWGRGSIGRSALARHVEDDSMLVDKITEKISISITETRTSNGSNLVGIDAHMKALSRLLDLNSKKSVRVIGIWARGGNGRSALAKHVYRNIRQHFESHCFLENVKRISQDRHMSHLHDEILVRIPGECLSLKNQRVLLVADDVDKLEQLDALAEDFNCFGPGSVVIITTQDKQLLHSFGIKLVYEAEHLRFLKVRELFFRQLAFKKRDISAAFGRATNVAMELLGCLRVRSGYRKVLESVY